MASANVEEEYESDPEEAKLLLAMRRRVASDDEEDEGLGDVVVERRGDEVLHVADVRESDEEGAAEDYDEEEDELVRVEDVRETASVVVENEVRGEERDVMEGGVGDGKDGEDRVEGGEDEKKEQEPFAVPTAGAFYMHDDRFRDNAAGRIRTLGAQKLWESKDERRWGHDKFEELTFKDSPYNESRRNFRSHHRGRGRNRGSGRGYVRGNRLKIPEDNDNRAPVSTTVKGRGPKRYEPAYKHRNEVPQTQKNKQSGKYQEISAHSNSAKGSVSVSTLAYDQVPAKKNLVPSNLNSASPPFYPSGTSNMDINQAPKQDAQPPNINRTPQPSSVDENLATKHANTVPRGKGVDDSLGLKMKKLSLDDSVTKHSNASLVHPSGFRNPSQGRQVRTQGRGQGYAGHVPSQSTAHPDHASKFSGAQLHANQRLPLVQSRTQSYSRSPAHPVPNQIGEGVLPSSSPPGGYASPKSFENGEESRSESSKAKTDVVGKTAGAVQGGALGPFMYNGAQIMGANVGVTPGDQNFPTFLPVMQFGAQHPGGIGVPAVGMAFPGYVQPQHGQGSSEMTWLPVLAGAAGALGASYCPPYMLDGSTYNHQLADSQFTSSSSNKVDDTNRAISEWIPSQKLEHAGEEFEQRQSKPRRYSEMKFGQ